MRSISTIVLALSSAALVVAAPATPKPKKPQLDVRASPRMASSPATILFTAELKGGDDVEELHCPELEWEWDDGGRSVHQEDCAPFEAGTVIQRRYTTEHRYTRGGAYSVKVRMKRTGKTIASANISVTVRPGIGDLSDVIVN